VTIDIFERYAALDPAKSSDMQPESNTTVAVHLLVPDGREPTMQTHQETPPQQETTRKPRVGLFVAAAAAALVLIVGAATLLVTGSDPDTAPAVAPSTTVPIVTEADALAVSNAYIVALNAGDVDAMMALLVPGAAFETNFGEVMSSAEQEMFFTWNAAQGTTFTSQGCSAAASEAGLVITVTCTGATFDALSQALSAPPVPSTFAMAVTPEGASSLRYTYGTPDFTVAGRPFLAWMEADNPDDVEKAGFGFWSTIDEAREFGELRARYATEWASYIEENGCPFASGC